MKSKLELLLVLNSKASFIDTVNEALLCVAVCCFALLICPIIKNGDFIEGGV